MNLPWLLISTLSTLLGIASVLTLTCRQRWSAARRLLVTQQCADAADIKDRALAHWTRNTKISVNTVTGAWVSMTLAELANSPVPHRGWNVPISVELHPKDQYVGAVDEDQAKEHRG